MIGFATITLSTSSVRAEETTDQSSYPLKSENAIPLGDFSEYLSAFWTCALRALATATAITATTMAASIKPPRAALGFSLLCRCFCATDFVTDSDIVHSPPQKEILQ